MSKIIGVTFILASICAIFVAFVGLRPVTPEPVEQSVDHTKCMLPFVDSDSPDNQYGVLKWVRPISVSIANLSSHDTNVLLKEVKDAVAELDGIGEVAISAQVAGNLEWQSHHQNVMIAFVERGSFIPDVEELNGFYSAIRQSSKTALISFIELLHSPNAVKSNFRVQLSGTVEGGFHYIVAEKYLPWQMGEPVRIAIAYTILPQLRGSKCPIVQKVRNGFRYEPWVKEALVKIYNPDVLPGSRLKTLSISPLSTSNLESK